MNTSDWVNANDWEQQAQYYRQDAATAWDKCEELRRELEAAKISIRRLDWQERYQLNADQESEVVAYVATTGLGTTYRVEIDYFRTDGEWQLSYGSVIGNFVTPDEAKAKAQADFEERIWSAILSEMQPPSGETIRTTQDGSSYGAICTLCGQTFLLSGPAHICQYQEHTADRLGRKTR